MNPDLYYLGPITYFNSLTKDIYGKELNEYPDINVLNLIREALNLSPFTMTYREDNDTTIVYDNQLTWYKGNEESKEDFYKNNKVTHWTKKI